MAASGSGWSLTLCLIAGLLAAAVDGQKVYVAHKPSYVGLRSDAMPMRVTEVQDVLGLILGLHTVQDLRWDGLFSGNAFQRPRAAVLLVSEGSAGQTFDHLRSEQSYDVDPDEPVVSTSRLESRLRSLYGKNSLAVELSELRKLSDVQDEYTPLFDDVPSGKHAIIHSLRTDPDSVYAADGREGSLNASDPAYYHALAELETVRHLLTRAGKRHQLIDGIVVQPHGDLFTIYLDGYLKAAAAHGVESPVTRNAWHLTDVGLPKVVEAARQAYGNDVVVMLLTMKPSALTAEERLQRSRSARSLLSVYAADAADNRTLTNSSINLGASYRNDYNAIFNIVLWFCIIFFLVVVYVAFGIWHMDPGRESIIYRMTMQRIKKDN